LLYKSLFPFKNGGNPPLSLLLERGHRESAKNSIDIWLKNFSVANNLVFNLKNSVELNFSG